MARSGARAFTAAVVHKWNPGALLHVGTIPARQYHVNGLSRDVGKRRVAGKSPPLITSRHRLPCIETAGATDGTSGTTPDTGETMAG